MLTVVNMCLYRSLTRFYNKNDIRSKVRTLKQIKMAERYKLSEEQKVELEGAFKLLRPNTDGKIKIDHINSMIQTLEEASIANESRSTDYKQSRSEPNSPAIPFTSETNRSSYNQRRDQLYTPSPTKVPKIELESFPNGSQEFSFDQFIELIEESLTNNELFEETLMQTFRLLDVKKTGFIDPSDLAMVGNIVGENINEEEALRLLKLADVMDLNKISYNEFHSFFLKDIKPDT